MGYGVSACATCDGAFFKNKEIVGGRRRRYRDGGSDVPDPILQRRFRSCIAAISCGRRRSCRSGRTRNPKIAFVWDSVIDEIYGEPKTGVSGVRLRIPSRPARSAITKPTGSSWRSAIEPNTAVFEGKLEMDELGYLKVRAGFDVHQYRGCVRRRRRGGSGLSAGGDSGGHRMHGGDRRRALAGGAASSPIILFSLEAGFAAFDERANAFFRIRAVHHLVPDSRNRGDG